jgi:hypothetical protein
MYQTIPAKYIESLLREGHYFTPSRSFRDQMEFYYGYCLFNNAMMSEQDIKRCVQRTANDEAVRRLVNSTCVSCWVSELQDESQMWNVHGSGGAAIRISVAVNDFCEYVENQGQHIVSGPVTYEGQISMIHPQFLTPSRLTDNENEIYHYFFHKRSRYSWEREFRIILFSSKAVSIRLNPDIINSVSFSPIEKLDPNLEQLVRDRFGRCVRES